MKPVKFEKSVVSRRQAGELLIAFFDGAQKGTPHALVNLLSCSDEVGRALLKALSSALKGSKT